MSEKITITNQDASHQSGNMANIALWMAIAHRSPNELDALLEQAKIEKKLPFDVEEVKLSINGVEIPFTETLNRFTENIDEYIQRKAKELIKDKFDDVEELLYNWKQKLIGEVGNDY